MTAVLDEIARSGELSDQVAALASRVQSSVVLVRGSRAGTGSGVVWNDSGLIVTNNHVATGDSAQVIVDGVTRRAGRVVARAEALDVAAIQLDEPLPGSAMPAVIGDSTELRPGALLIAVGNPMGERNAVTLGVLSGLGAGGRGRFAEAIRVAITLRPGNSGGALADVLGRVVGIPNMVVGDGLALAVPSHIVQQFLTAARRAGLMAA